MRGLHHIQYGSHKKTALYYIKMRRKDVPFEDVVNFLRHYGKRPYRIREGLDSLEACGFVKSNNKDKWQITPLGLEAVRALGQRDKNLSTES